jgi:hypothetical protein
LKGVSIIVRDETHEELASIFRDGRNPHGIERGVKGDVRVHGWAWAWSIFGDELDWDQYEAAIQSALVPITEAMVQYYAARRVTRE